MRPSSTSFTAHPEPGRSAQPPLPLKLTPPPPRAGVLLRPDLQAVLSEVRLNPLTLVVAPAGYGKTTLLAQWVQELTRTGAPVVWLSLDAGDRDPALFLASLIHAIQRVARNVGGDAWRVLHSVANLDHDWPLVAGALASDLQRKVATATFLFLDDLHLAAESAVISQIIGYLLRAAPPSLHIVLASRRAPTFAPLARLRAEGRLVDIGQRDLHLDADDIRQVLAAQGVALDKAALALLLERTDGWALSVQLAARALASQPSNRRAAFVEELGCGQEQIFSYLATEVLTDLPRELLAFLRLAAIPSNFDAELLSAVLERDDVGYLLGRAQALGLPLQPIGERGDLLAFHPLWREVLLRDAARQLTPDGLEVLRRRFGQTLEARGELEAALHHYAAAGAADDLARALRERAWPLLRSPQRDMVRRWLEGLPAALRDADAELLYMWGVSQAYADPMLAATTIERAADQYCQAELHERMLRAQADLATILVWQARPAKLLATCLRAVRTANRVDDDGSRGAALVCAAMMLSLKSRNDALRAALRVARHAEAYPLYPSWRWLHAMTVAGVGIQLGMPDAALQAIDTALQLPAVDDDDRLRQSLLGQKSVALFEQGQVAEATAMALESHRSLSDYHRGGIAASSAARLALLLVLQGRVDEAMTYVAQARAAYHELGALTLLADLQAIELYGLMLRGQAANARSAVAGVLRRLREQNAGAPDLRTWMLLALVLGESGEPHRALELAREIARQMEARGYRLFLACAWLYAAYLVGRLDNQADRTAELRAGWELVAADNLTYLALMPATALRDVALAGLHKGIHPEAIGRVLRRQLPEQSVALLLGLVGEPAAPVRASVARLLGDTGAAAAYPALRALAKDSDTSVRRAAEQALGRVVYRPPYQLRIRSLGAFAIWRGDQELRDRDWRSSRARQLFQFLLTERGRTVPRDRVLETFWPDMAPDGAANNLRVTLNRLSKALEPDRPDGAPSSYVLQQGETYTFNVQSDYQLDAADFAAAVLEGQRAERSGQRQTAIAALRRAVALYNGPYLPDASYEDWTVVERERLTMLFSDAAIRLGLLLLDEGMAHEAIGLAWRVLESDQAHEDAYRLLMRAHAYLGERSTALRIYQRCVDALREELGVEPMRETEALADSLRELR